jgi:hypothetical protein
VDRVRALGADVVVDYKRERFEDFAQGVDLVLDTVGGETRERSWPLLRKGGALASLLPPPPDPATAERYGVQAFMVHGHPNIVEIMPDMTRAVWKVESWPFRRLQRRTLWSTPPLRIRISNAHRLVDDWCFLLRTGLIIFRHRQC